MKDLKIATARVALTVTSVSPIRGFLPPSVIILGEQFNLATEIRYNEVEVTEYIVASPTRIIARVPPAQVGQLLTNLEVLTTVPLAQKNALINLKTAKPIKALEGMDRLIQEWVLVFLSTPGSDIFNPSAGGGALALIGKNDKTANSNITADLTLAVMNTKNQILKAQASNLKIPPSERLLSCTLVSVKFDRKNTTLSAVVDLKNILGKSAVVTVG